MGVLALIAGIAALVALITAVVKLTLLAMSWISNKVKEKLKNRNTQKVAIGDINKIIESCDNQVSIDALEEIAEKGATHIVADVDYNGNVESVEAFDVDKIEGRADELINRTGEGLVVIS